MNCTHEDWARGYGPIQHSPDTQQNVARIAERLRDSFGDGVPLYDLLWAADRLACAGMWLVVHMTYANTVPLPHRDLCKNDFKPEPEGHTGGSLNMVPGYVGYLAANALSGQTRSWVMGQGHCVAAIDAVNLLVGNTKPAHDGRYSVTAAGLSRFVQDFYSYRLTSEGKTESPLGSHVNAHTAGGMVEGGYLGFTELQYVHMPLPGETLVTFLSDGAWEEQRGSDWAPRWWRAEDCGTVLPIMIYNGRRIDQRTTEQMEGGPSWFERHLALNSFDPILFDGRDPAAFVCTIFEMESRLSEQVSRIERGGGGYPVRMPYGVAVAPKGAGFPGEGTNLAHNLPLGGNPHEDDSAAKTFNEGARRLAVPPEELRDAVGRFNRHEHSSRPRERDHALAHRRVTAKAPDVPWKEIEVDRQRPREWEKSSPMSAIDSTFLEFLRTNPELRPRVGSPDEMESNRMKATLAELKFRVTAPEEGRPESLHGAVVSALNEEAIAGAATGNKGGINLIVTYEAFATKMHGLLRQEITFSNGLSLVDQAPGWLSVPLVLTSQTWENAKNEFSHQDPAITEAMLGEPAQVSRVVFPADYNTAAASLMKCYATQGEIWTLVVPKGSLPELFTPEEARNLVDDGAAAIDWLSHRPDDARLILIALGGYQLSEIAKASFRLRERDVAHLVVYILEPGRLRVPRSTREAEHVLSDEQIDSLFPASADCRVLLTHTRPEPVLGILSRIHTGPCTTGLGFRNDGGTLDTAGMLWVNGCSWAHCLRAAARAMKQDEALFLSGPERRALDGELAPDDVIAWRP